MNQHPGIIGKKLGATQIFLDDGTVVACTVVQAGSTVVGKRTLERDGYDALIVGFGEKTARRSNKSEIVAMEKAGVAIPQVMRELRCSAEHAAKYELGHVVRVHLGADDVAYECVYQREDAKGIIGVELNRDLVKVAGKALVRERRGEGDGVRAHARARRPQPEPTPTPPHPFPLQQKNMTKMAPLVLPLSEQLKFAAVWAVRAALPPNHPRRPAPYVPDFKKAFDHFCLHAGGRGVIEGLSKQLALPAGKQAPSYNSLFWYGNTSSASLWYALGYIETVQGVKSGDVVWQVGFGSGFKCNSAVWTALRPIKETAGHAAWAHMAHPSNVGAVDAYLKNGGTSQGPGAPACAGTRGGGEGRVTSPRAARAAKRA